MVSGKLEDYDVEGGVVAINEARKEEIYYIYIGS
jgi:hypothetical protein